MARKISNARRERIRQEMQENLRIQTHGYSAGDREQIASMAWNLVVLRGIQEGVTEPIPADSDERFRITRLLESVTG